MQQVQAIEQKEWELSKKYIVDIVPVTNENYDLEISLFTVRIMVFEVSRSIIGLHFALSCTISLSLNPFYHCSNI